MPACRHGNRDLEDLSVEEIIKQFDVTREQVTAVLGHSDAKTTQRHLNITDEELRKTLTGVWERRRQLKAVGE